MRDLILSHKDPFQSGEMTRKIVLIHKSKMNSIGLILINPTFLCLQTEQLLVLKILVF